MRTRFIAIALLSAASCVAQVRVGSPAPRFGGNFPHHRSSFYLPVFASDNFYSDAAYPRAPQPPVVILQTPQAAPVTDPPAPVTPLMIELQAGRYVHVTSDDGSRLPVEQPTTSPRAMQLATQPAEAQPVILIFRDGHREEVGGYTIAGGMLYSRGDYYNDGSWTKQIDLHALNLAETVAANQSRGIRFQLPASPNEVIARF